MELKYHRELNHNYLIIKNGAESDGYKSRMLATNKLDGFLSVSKRNINSESYMLYEITSMQSLVNIYSLRGMPFEDLKNLLGDMKKAISTAAEYLLDESGIILSPECIMKDLSSKKYHFVYMPNGGNEWDFKKFTEEMLDLVDQNDEKAIQLAYSLCQLAERQGIMISEAIDLSCEFLKDVEKEDHDFARNMDTAHYEKEENIKVPDKAYEEIEDKIEEPKRTTPKDYLFSGILGILFAIVEMFLLYIRANYLLTDSENVMTLALMALAFLMIVLSAASVVIKVKKVNIISEKESSEEEEFELMDSNYNQKDYYPKKDHYSQKEVACNLSDNDYGQTIVLDTYNAFNMHRLYGKENGKAINIDLDNFPITIGKMSGMADVVLSNKSISRLHARIYESKENGGLLLEDMNSTNGTFLNGIRLKPQEKVEIRPGDEIRFAEMRFDYR